MHGHLNVKKQLLAFSSLSLSLSRLLRERYVPSGLLGTKLEARIWLFRCNHLIEFLPTVGTHT